MKLCETDALLQRSLTTVSQEQTYCMAWRQYSFWSSPISQPWSSSIIRHLQYTATKTLIDGQQPSWLDSRRQMLQKTQYPNAAWPLLSLKKDADVSLAYLDFYNAQNELPCIRLWTTLDISCTNNLRTLKSWLADYFDPTPVPPLLLLLHPSFSSRLTRHSLPLTTLRCLYFTHNAHKALKAFTGSTTQISLKNTSAQNIYKQYLQAMTCFKIRHPSIPSPVCNYQDALSAQNSNLLLKAVNVQGETLGVLMLNKEPQWGFPCLNFLEKCLFPGYRHCGLGKSLEYALYRYLDKKGINCPILGGIFKKNQASTQCALAFKRQLWCSETLFHW